MSTKKQNKNKSNKKSTRTQRQVSNGYVSRRVPTGMTQIGVADDGTIVYSGTPQVTQQYWSDLYALNPGAPGYIFTGKNGVYTPVRKSNHAYDDVIAANPVRAQETAIGPEITVIGHNNNVQEPEVSTYGEGPVSNPYNANDPFLQERFRQQFWNDGGRDIWLKQVDAKARALTPTLGTFAKLAAKPIEAAMPSNLLGTLFKQLRNPSLSRLSSDLLGSGFGGGNLGLTEISDRTAQWAQNNPEANGVINMFGDVGAGLLTAPTRALINQGFRAITPSTYVTSGLTNAGRAIGGNTGRFIASNAGRAGTAADLIAFGIPAYNAWEGFAENPTVANGIIATGATVPAAVPAFKTFKATIPRMYNTTNGKVVGYPIGEYAVGFDASGRNIYSGLPMSGGRIIRQPISIEGGDMGSPTNTLPKVGDYVKLGDGEVGQIIGKNDLGYTVSSGSIFKGGRTVRMSANDVADNLVSIPEIPRGTIITYDYIDNIGTPRSKKYVATGNMSKNGAIQVQNSDGANEWVPHNKIFNNENVTITGETQPLIPTLQERFQETVVPFVENNLIPGIKSRFNKAKDIVSKASKATREKLQDMQEARAAKREQKAAEAQAQAEQQAAEVQIAENTPVVTDQQPITPQTETPPAGTVVTPNSSSPRKVIKINGLDGEETVGVGDILVDKNGQKIVIKDIVNGMIETTSGSKITPNSPFKLEKPNQPIQSQPENPQQSSEPVITRVEPTWNNTNNSIRVHYDGSTYEASPIGHNQYKLTATDGSGKTITLHKSVYNNEAIPIDENNIAIHMVGRNYSSPNGKYRILSSDSSGMLKVRNTNTGEIEDIDSIEFFKRLKEPPHRANNHNNNEESWQEYRGHRGMPTWGKVALGMGITGIPLGGTLWWLNGRNDRNNGNYIVDPLTGDTITEQQADSIRQKLNYYKNATQVDTTNRVQNTHTDEDSIINTNNAGTLQTETPSVVSTENSNDTIWTPDGQSYQLKSNPGMIYYIIQ